MSFETFNIEREVPEFLKDRLDPEQLDAVLNSEGKSLIIAGPGSGKTQVITYKIAYLLHSGVRPENILLVTFTRAASKQMIERVRNVTNVDIKSLTAGTFHHVCNILLRRYAARLNYKNNFTILDSEDAQDMMRIIRNEYKEEIGSDTERKLPKESVILKVIGYASNSLISLRESITQIAPYLMEFEHDIETMWIRYSQLKHDLNAMDYDDILINTARLLNENKDILEYVSSQYRYILVDEFQDTNKIQLDIVEALSKVHGNLIAVGDDAQSIYSFRGARFENVKDFMSEENTKMFKIQTNYRSTPEIVELVNNMIPGSSIPKHLKSARGSQVKPVVIETFDELEQSEAVLKILRDKSNEGIDYSDMAILYRTHSLSMSLQQKLDSKKIPYRLLSGKRFIETAHIKDILAFIKIIFNPIDKVSWARTLKLFEGIGDKTAHKIYEYIFNSIREGLDMTAILPNSPMKKYKTALEFYSFIYTLKDKSPTEIIKEIYEKFYKNYAQLTFKDARSRNADIERFIEIASSYDELTEFLEEMALSENIEVVSAEKGDKEDQITMTTIHGAKGLEWKVVILISVNPGDFPNGMALKEKKLDEEERLFYVAITRAKDELFIIKQTSGATNPYFSNTFVMVKAENDFIRKIPKDTIKKYKIGYSHNNF